MSYTLISLLGTGMYKKEGGYRQTTYCFPDGKEITGKVFLEALRESSFMPDIQKIIIAGTRTSDWGALLPSAGQYDEDLYLHIIENPDGISDESLLKLADRLTAIYGKKCVLKAHTPTIDKNTVEEVFRVYNSIAKEIDPGTDILFDITHGFRSMPVLLYQALQYSISDKNRRKVKIIYGEYIEERKISVVRDLSSYWELSEITAALRLFHENLDGSLLAEKLADCWPDGAKWIKRFTGIVQTNFSIQLKEAVQQLGNILKKQAVPSECPYWVSEVRTEFEVLYKRLNKICISEILYEYAALLGEMQLYVQAIIALQITVEARILEKLNAIDTLGDYEFYKNKGKQTCDAIFDTSWDSQLKNKIKNLEHLRNQIAHGGAQNPETGGYPQIENLDKQFETGKNAVAQFFKIDTACILE